MAIYGFPWISMEIPGYIFRECKDPHENPPNLSHDGGDDDDDDDDGLADSCRFLQILAGFCRILQIIAEWYGFHAPDCLRSSKYL